MKGWVGGLDSDTRMNCIKSMPICHLHIVVLISFIEESLLKSQTVHNIECLIADLVAYEYVCSDWRPANRRM